MKIAVAFPGIGYTCDRPLLYYSKKLAKSLGYTVRDVPYDGFASKKNMIGNEALMREAYEHALAEAEKLLCGIRWQDYERVVFLSKSVGTAVAAAYAREHRISAKHIYYTPLAGTFEVMEEKSGIAFHGTADPWASDEAIEKGCRAKGIPLTIIPESNHSLETGDVLKDIANLGTVMRETDHYLKEL